MKQLAFLILGISFIAQVYSQDKNIDFQLSFGSTISIPKLSKLTNTDVLGAPEIKSSINIGAYILPSINYSFDDKKSLDFGVGYYLDRFSIENKIGYTTNKGNRNISQIQVPINLNFHMGSDNSYLLGIGGFTSFLISAKEKGDMFIDYSSANIIGAGDVFLPNSSVSYSNNIKNNYNSLSFGAFIQLKKLIVFTPEKKGFVLFKINQYINSIKNNDSKSDLSKYLDVKNEKEPTTVNLGVGLIF